MRVLVWARSSITFLRSNKHSIGPVRDNTWHPHLLITAANFHACVWLWQTRAHALLKGKDAELRDARAVAETHFAESLRTAEAALADVHRELSQVQTQQTPNPKAQGFQTL